jgi:hypothetical protein
MNGSVTVLQPATPTPTSGPPLTPTPTTTFSTSPSPTVPGPTSTPPSTVPTLEPAGQLAMALGLAAAALFLLVFRRR